MNSAVHCATLVFMSLLATLIFNFELLEIGRNLKSINLSDHWACRDPYGYIHRGGGSGQWHKPYIELPIFPIQST